MNEEDIRKMSGEMAKIPGMPKPMILTVQYNKELQKITGKVEHPMIISEGATFSFLLQNILMEYPEITKRYPPGALGFSINSVQPKMYTPLFDGDKIVFTA